MEAGNQLKSRGPFTWEMVSIRKDSLRSGGSEGRSCGWSSRYNINCCYDSPNGHRRIGREIRDLLLEGGR